MAAEAPSDSGSSKRPDKRKSWTTWLIAAAFLLVWNIVFFPRPTASVTIPYSTFLARVRAGDITTVHLIGDDISGTFVHRYTLPPIGGSLAAASTSGNASSAVL
jgi:hypothetical protein